MKTKPWQHVGGYRPPEVSEEEGDGQLGVTYYGAAQPAVPGRYQIINEAPHGSGGYQAHPAPPPLYGIKLCFQHNAGDVNEYLIRVFLNGKQVADQWLGQQTGVNAAQIVWERFMQLVSGQPVGQPPVTFLPGMKAGIDLYLYDQIQNFWCRQYSVGTESLSYSH